MHILFNYVSNTNSERLLNFGDFVPCPGFPSRIDKKFKGQGTFCKNLSRGRTKILRLGKYPGGSNWYLKF